MTIFDLTLKLWPIFFSLGSAIFGGFLYVMKLRADVNALRVKLKADVNALDTKLSADVNALNKTFDFLHKSLSEPLKEIASMAKDVRGIKTDLDWITGRKKKQEN